MKNIVILGAGGDGKTYVDIINRINSRNKTWNILGYLDDDINKLNKTYNKIKVIGLIDHLGKIPECYCISSLGSPKKSHIKKMINDRIAKFQPNYTTIIDPDSFVSQNAKIGVDVIIYQYVSVQSDVQIKNHVKVFPHTNFGHDSIINDFVTVTSNVSVSGNVEIKEGAYLGTACNIRENLTVGEWSIIGMGSVIVKDVPPHSIVVGNPGKIIGTTEI